MLTFAMIMSACGAVVGISSAYVVSCTESGHVIIISVFAHVVNIFL